MGTPRQASAALDRLDRALIAARQWVTRPEFRRQFFSRLDVTVELTTIRVLRAIERFEGPQDPTIGDLARALGVAPSTASRFVDSVVEGGHLERRPCATDARRTRLIVTDAGRQTLAAVNGARREVLAEVVAGWSPDDLRLIADLLDQLGKRFDEFEGQT